MQKLLLATQRAKMITNHAKRDSTCKPVVKLFCPWGGATWLLSELDPTDDVAFGLCDLGMGSPELGYVSLDEIRSIRGPAGLYIERDKWFTANKSLTEYADEAYDKGRIQA